MRLELRYGFPMCVTMQWPRTSMVRFEVRENPVKDALISVLDIL